MAEWVFLNGQLIAADEAKVSAFDAGFTHAAGLFETLRAYGGQVFRLQDHLDRMIASAKALDMPAIVSAVTQAHISDGIGDLLTANNFQEARLRIVATPGNIPRPGIDDETLTPTLLITASQLPTPSPAHASHPSHPSFGMRVCISPFRVSPSDPLRAHKTLSYLPRLLAMRDAQQRKCQESLWFTTENMLAEGSVCNVFILHQGKLLTPPLDTPVLPGVIRKAVIELAGSQEIATEESPIDIDNLLSSSEVFLTNSIMEIMPVTAIEKHAVGSGAAGKFTRQLMRSFSDLVAKECAA